MPVVCNQENDKVHATFESLALHAHYHQYCKTFTLRIGILTPLLLRSAPRANP